MRREQMTIGQLIVNEILMNDRINSDQTIGFNVDPNGNDDLTTGFQVTGTVTYAFKANDGALKLHCHDRSSQSYAAEIKYDWQATTGQAFGIDCTCEIEPGGSTPANRTAGGLRAVQGVARVGSGFTITGGTDIGVYGQFCNNGTLNGTTYPTAIYGLIENGGTYTQVSVLSVAWLDSHLAKTISAGDAYFLNITNNAATTVWTAAIHVYGGNNITNFVKIDTASGMVSANDTGGSTIDFDNWKTIKIDIDGTTHYLIAAQTIANS
jgi:hypothetical protein